MHTETRDICCFLSEVSGRLPGVLEGVAHCAWHSTPSKATCVIWHISYPSVAIGHRYTPCIGLDFHNWHIRYHDVDPKQNGVVACG